MAQPQAHSATVQISKDLLRAQPLLKLLDNDLLAQVMTHSRFMSVPKRTMLMMKGGGDDWLGFLLGGKVQVVDVLHNGREVGLNIIRPGSFFGELSCIDRRPRSATLLAMSPCYIIQVPGEIARQLFFRSPPVAEAMMKHCTDLIRRMSDLRSLQAIPNAFTRVFALINYFKIIGPGGLEVIEDAPTQQEMAIMVNTSRETVSRAISELMRMGVVEKDLRRLIIRKPEILRMLVETEAAPQGVVDGAGAMLEVRIERRVHAERRAPA
jgi:CRP-like cAMP-binding protein